MKKRVISFVLVLTLIFTGAFSCIASADSSAVQKYFNLYRQYLRGLGESLFDPDFFGLIGDLTDLLGEQQDAIDNHSDDLGDLRLYYECGQQWVGIDFSGAISNYDYLKDCSYHINVENFNTSDYYSRYNLGNAYCLAVPNEYSSFVDCSFDGRFYTLTATGNITYYYFVVITRLNDNGTTSSGIRYSEVSVGSCSSGQQFYSTAIDPNPTSYVCRRCAVNDFGHQVIKFSGTSSETPGTINLFLNASRDIVSDVDGTFMIGFGILYDDGSDRMYCGDFIDFRNVSSGSSWESSFDLKAFSEYAYRKRCPLTGYKAFIFAYQNGFVFNMEFPLEIDPPGGIFEDIDDPPDWKDYEPEPSEPPEPPSLDTDIFNFTFNTNNYVIYNFQTIQNFSYSGGGSGGSGGGGGGGTGNDDSSVPDDSSSGGDSSGGDSSVDDSGSGGGVNINPEIDFDFGLLTAFLNWFADAFAALLGNLTGFFGAMLNNFKLLLDDLFKFYNDFSSYLTGYFNDWLEYFSQLIINFNTDFNNWCSSFATYIGDCIDVTDFNIQMVVSNLKQYFYTQFIPDSDNVNFILSDCLGWYYQIQQLLSSKSYSSTVFTLSLGDLGTFTLDDPQLFSQIRSLIGIIVMGFTAIKCLRLGFQMFGINIGGGDSDDS